MKVQPFNNAVVDTYASVVKGMQKTGAELAGHDKGMLSHDTTIKSSVEKQSKEETRHDVGQGMIFGDVDRISVVDFREDGSDYEDGTHIACKSTFNGGEKKEKDAYFYTDNECCEAYVKGSDFRFFSSRNASAPLIERFSIRQKTKKSSFMNSFFGRVPNFCLFLCILSTHCLSSDAFISKKKLNEGVLKKSIHRSVSLFCCSTR